MSEDNRHGEQTESLHQVGDTVYILPNTGEIEKSFGMTQSIADYILDCTPLVVVNVAPQGFPVPNVLLTPTYEIGGEPVVIPISVITECYPGSQEQRTTYDRDGFLDEEDISPRHATIYTMHETLEGEEEMTEPSFEITEIFYPSQDFIIEQVEKTLAQRTLTCYEVDILARFFLHGIPYLTRRLLDNPETYINVLAPDGIELCSTTSQPDPRTRFNPPG